MMVRNVLTVLATATATAALTLALLAPRGGDAQAGLAVQPVIPPQLASQGCTFTLKTDKGSYEAGQSAMVEVTAVNPTDKPVTVSVWAAATGSAPVSRMSRMLPIPVTFWSHEYAFTLPPNGTMSLAGKCDAMGAGQNVTILLSDQQNAVMAGNMGIPPSAVQNSNPQNAVQPNAFAPNAAPRPTPKS